MDKVGGRALKKRVGELLDRPDSDESLAAICALSKRRVVNPLFSFLYHLTPSIRWRAVSAMGAVVAALFEDNAEAARIVMRRFIWNLNDESGGIGWGSPEAMGDIMARSRSLADEYAHMLVSYIQPEGNYLEHPELQKGLLWGLGRLAHVRPGHVQAAAPFLIPFLESSDADHRGLAAWVAQAVSDKALFPVLQNLLSDRSRLSIYIDQALETVTVAELAAPAARSAARMSA